MRIGPISPARISALDVSRNNLLASKSGYLYFRVNDLDCRTRLLTWPQVEDFDFAIEIDLMVGAETVAIDLTRWPFDRLQTHDLDTREIALWPAELRVAAAEIELDGLLQIAEAILNRQITVRAVRHGPQLSPKGRNTKPAGYDTAIALQLESRSGSSTTCCIRSSGAVYRELLKAIAQLGGDASDAHDTTAYHARIEVASIRLPRTALRQLAKGDVILLEHHVDPSRLAVRINLDNGIRIIATSTGDTVVVEAVERIPSQEFLGADELDALNVTLTFEVGTLGMNFGDLKAIRPGHTFVIGRTIERVVHIHCNGKLVGIGELVQVDDRSGVRVLEIFGFKNG